MAKLNILHYPDARLRTVARPIAVVDDRIRQLAKDMAETMYDAPGIGLAATQVNVHERIIVVDVSDDQSDLRVLINPSGSQDREERSRASTGESAASDCEPGPVDREAGRYNRSNGGRHHH